MILLISAVLFVTAIVAGDVNSDGKVDFGDLTDLLRHIVGLSSGIAIGNADITDATGIIDEIQSKNPKLTSLTVDGDENISFDANTLIYTIELPLGRPRIPQVSATAGDGLSVKIYQATMADGETEGMAKILVSDNDSTGTYQVRFIKKAEKGFVLQYDDRYSFKPSYTLSGNETFTFSSSSESTASIDSSGMITAKAISSSPVTITATVNGDVKDTLVIDKIVKAQINFFLITGQSNAAGSSDDGVDRTAEKNASTKPRIGTVYCVDVAHTGVLGTLYDLSAGRNGFSPALSKTWYDLTGQKVLVIQTAQGGSPIENWEKGGDPYYGAGSKNLYDNTLAAYTHYRNLYDNPSSNYEVLRVHYYWCQGETAMANTWTGKGWDNTGYYIMPADTYYSKFMSNHANFVNEMDVSLGAIMLVRATTRVAIPENTSVQLLTDLVPARAAQYALHNTNGDDLAIMSRISDIARMVSSTDKTSPGYGYMGPQNLHYLQTGYNAQGVELATNSFMMINAYSDRTATELEVIDTNGRTRLDDGHTISVETGSEYQITAMVLPLYNDSPKVTFSVTSGSEFCSVDKYGNIKIDANATVGSEAVLLIESESGLKKTLGVKVTGSLISDVSYQWDFDNLNEKDGKNNLKLSEKASAVTNPESYYSFSNGILTLKDKKIDFEMEKSFYISNEFDWSIEWRGSLSSNSCLFGTEGSTTNFLYLAYGVSAWNYPFRIVSGTGSALMIPYGTHASKNTSMNTWKVTYTASTKTMTLYILGELDAFETVGTVTLDKDFTATFTHMFGRYSDAANVNYNGQIDYIKVTARTKNEVTE